MDLSKSIVVVSVILLISGCSSGLELTTENPYSQASVVIHQKDGQKKEGIVLKREGNNLIYIDSKTHKKETIDYAQIQKLTEASVNYDFEANPIPDYIISEEKSMSNALSYGSGGFLLGATLGAGVGIGLVAADVDLPPLISIGLFGVAGAWYLGSKGAEKDFEDAVFEVRKKRYLVSKSQREMEIEEAKRKLVQQQKEKEELQKKIQEKKKIK